MVRLLILFLMAAPCVALQTHPFMDQQHRTVYIAKKGLNRIAIFGERIQQVFGDDGAFDLQSDEGSGQIFIRAESKAPFTITLITESGLTQDLTLIPNRKAFQSILLKPTTPSPTLPKKPLKERIRALLATMRRNHAQKVHRTDGLEGRIHTLKNKSRRVMVLEESKLAGPHDLAIFLSKRRLKPGEKALQFTIRRMP